MSDGTDYDAVNVPDGKPRENYSYVERRAEVLNRIERAGHPDALTKSELPREYGVSLEVDRTSATSPGVVHNPLHRLRFRRTRA